MAGPFLMAPPVAAAASYGAPRPLWMPRAVRDDDPVRHCNLTLRQYRPSPCICWESAGFSRLSCSRRPLAPAPPRVRPCRFAAVSAAPSNHTTQMRQICRRSRLNLPTDRAAPAPRISVAPQGPFPETAGGCRGVGARMLLAFLLKGVLVGIIIAVDRKSV